MLNRLAQPAALERTRTAIARIIFCYLTIPSWIALRIAPRHHPWRELMSSTRTDVRELTWATLRPRKESGEVDVVVEEPPRKLGAAFTLLGAYVLYAIVARTTELIPVLLPYLTDEALLTF